MAKLVELCKPEGYIYFTSVASKNERARGIGMSIPFQLRWYSLLFLLVMTQCNIFKNQISMDGIIQKIAHN